MHTGSPASTLLGPNDLHLFNEGSHTRLYQHLGAHPLTVDRVAGTYFAVWAPAAEYVAVIGDFNYWDRGTHPLKPRESSGIWEGFVPNVGVGTNYKYHVASRHMGYRVDKADPFGFCHENPPKTASVVWDLKYDWNDGDWMAQRHKRNSLNGPMAIYEVHLGSWMRGVDNRTLSYREMAPRLADYVEHMGYTHIEFLPLTEHPFYGSWGYQTTGFFAPTRRYGDPQDFMHLVDFLHQRGIGVILDWVPSHFPSDEHGLAYFDGTHLYEHADTRQGFHPDWGSLIFNYGRHEVRSFLLSSALFWLDKYHIDGLRVDAVASMLYLDYSRQPGEWIPNIYGGNENLDAITFLRRFNEEVYRNYPDVQTIAEESTAWPLVSRPTYLGGLGFGLKWDMGWMHDTLQYMHRDPVHRKYHQNELTFRGLYMFTENYVLPLSHDEIVHGKNSLRAQMPGDDWQQFAQLRLLFGNMYAQPGKKLMFMGDEFGQSGEWRHDVSLDWHVADYQSHGGVAHWVRDLNIVYRNTPALYEQDFSHHGFEWIDTADGDGSTLSFLRKAKSSGERVVVVFNFTPVPRFNYRLGVPHGGFWQELLNSDAPCYWGTGQGNYGGFDAMAEPWHGRSHSLLVTLPPLGVVFFKSPGP